MAQTKEEKRTRHNEYARHWRDKNRETARRLNREHYAANRMPYLNRAALARASSERAAPRWLTAQHWQEIAEVYLMAQRLTDITKVLHVVDHVWPLQGENSCGLHVPWNLEVITQAANVAKRNKEPNE
jgi:hypothetical protein